MVYQPGPTFVETGRAAAGGWTVYANLAEASAALAAMQDGMTGGGLDRAAVFTNVQLANESEQAFAGARDPRTGKAWEPRVRGTGPLLGGPGGSIAQLVRTGYRRGPTAARVFANLEYSGDRYRAASVLLYGVKARAKRSNRAARKRPGFVLPARRYIGLSRSAVEAIVEKCKVEFAGGQAE